MKKKNVLYSLLSAVFILLPVVYLTVKFSRTFYLDDLGAYCAISRALFEGHNPFPDHFELLFCKTHGGEVVPIVYPGQMLFFVIPAFLWGNTIQIIFFILNIGIVFFLVAMTLVKTCEYKCHDFLTPGKKQFVFSLCCCLYLLSLSVKETLKWGQIPIVLTLCFYLLFWGPVSFWLRTVFFAFIAVAKYSLLPVVAPLLFFKGHIKLCLVAFSVFIFLSVSPVFFHNNLLDVYTGYVKAVSIIVQPGHLNHYDSVPNGMCHLGFFKIAIMNYFLKAVVICVVLWLFWRERKKKYLSDTLLLLAFSLTMLISYHRVYDMVFMYPLFLIRFFDFARKKQWKLFGITFLFPVFLIIPSTISCNLIPSCIGGIPGMESIVYLSNYKSYSHIFPVMPIFTIFLAVWSLYLYLHVKDPYRFEIPENGKEVHKE